MVLHPPVMHMALFTMAGFVITLIAEWLATDMLDWWAYAERMPTLPLLQWMILPPLVIWFVQPQFA